MRTQYQGNIEIKIRLNRNVIKNETEVLEVKHYPKRKSNKKEKTVEQSNFGLESPSCKTHFLESLIEDISVKTVSFLLINKTSI